MKLKTIMAVVLAAGLAALNSFAYEVWLGTHGIPHSAATNLPAWSHTALRVQGLNILRGASAVDRASTADWQKIIPAFVNATENYTEAPRSNLSKDTNLVNERVFAQMTNWVSSSLSAASTYGYILHNRMLYNNVHNGKSYNWTTVEIQQLRKIYDGRGQTNVGVLFDARNFGVGVRKRCADPLITGVVIEGSANDIFANSNRKRDLAAWLFTNAATINKKIIFQMPRSENSLPQYQATREAVQRLGSLPPPLGTNFLRSSRVVFLLCNYHLGDPGQFTFAPETVPGNRALYTNTLTSLVLSLCEQRDLFEGRLAHLPTLADADSYVRNAPPDLGDIRDQRLNPGEVAGPLLGNSETPFWCWLRPRFLSRQQRSAVLLPVCR